MKQLAILFLSFFLLSGSCLHAQSLTGEYLNVQLKEKAIILNDYQNLLAEKDKDKDVKQYYMAQAMDLFVNQGKPFKVDTINSSGSTITMKSALRNKPVKRKVKDFLQGVMDLRYSPVDLKYIKLPTFPNQINDTDFVKCGDNLYRYTCLITRELAGYIDGTPVFRDIPPYYYTVFVSKSKTIDGVEYNVYLNDIEIEENQDKK